MWNRESTSGGWGGAVPPTRADSCHRETEATRSAEGSEVLPLATCSEGARGLSWVPPAMIVATAALYAEAGGRDQRAELSGPNERVTTQTLIRTAPNLGVQ